MSNMSYCRFRNTLPDLKDCYEHMEDEDLGDEEEEGKIQIIELCKKIAEEYAE